MVATYCLCPFLKCGSVIFQIHFYSRCVGGEKAPWWWGIQSYVIEQIQVGGSTKKCSKIKLEKWSEISPHVPNRCWIWNRHKGPGAQLRLKFWGTSQWCHFQGLLASIKTSELCWGEDLKFSVWERTSFSEWETYPKPLLETLFVGS